MLSLPFLCKLSIFSFLLLLVGCHSAKEDSSKAISVVWKEDKAKGLSISRGLLPNVSDEAIHTQLEVHLAGHGEQPAIAGDVIVNEKEVIFEPLIPLTRGLQYEVFFQHQPYAEVEIPRSTAHPELLAIYPTQDSLPENLLKIYLVFSRPMMEGHSLQYVKLSDDKGKNLPHTFLNLQSELWNTDRTILTLWLDPGRIKRDLQPNKLLGTPLTKGRQYKLIISSEWPDEQGASLTRTYTKSFVATVRDTLSPQPADWKLTVPKKGTMQTLAVDFGEPLDYQLLQNTLRVLDSRGSQVNGFIKLADGEKKYSFIPTKPWAKGPYTLQIEARLEDLGGNNLNRLFDVDLKTAHTVQPDKKVFEKKWRID